MASDQSTVMLNMTPLSRASSLPQLFCGVSEIQNTLRRMISRQRKSLLALQHRNLWQFAGLFSQIAADGADYPRQLITRMQLLIRNRALEDFTFVAAQGQQDATVRTSLGGHVEVGEQGSKFFLDQAHVYQLR